MVPEVSSVARLQDLDGMSEVASLSGGKVGFRPVASYAGGHLTDVGGTEVSDANDSQSCPDSPKMEFLGKARSEAWLDKKDDTVGDLNRKLHRTHEREDIRFGSLDEETPGLMIRSHEMENIWPEKADSEEVFIVERDSEKGE